LNLIAAAGLDPRGEIAALVLVLAIFAVPILALIGLYLAVPGRASTLLGSLRAWMEKNTARSRWCSASCSERSS
jgi:hypothetical protein